MNVRFLLMRGNQIVNLREFNPSQWKGGEKYCANKFKKMMVAEYGSLDGMTITTEYVQAY